MAKLATSASKADFVYGQVRERILDGTYTPGFRLILSTLADEYEVSTVPVREALRWLEAEGLVEYKHNAGAMVSRIDVSSYTESMTALAYLEGAATAIAAPEISAADLDKAEELNEEMRVITQALTFDSTAYRKLNARFHTVLCNPGKNERIKMLLSTEAERVNLIRRSSFKFSPSRSITSIEQHAHLLTLIRDGAEAQEIEMYARQHKLETLERTLDAMAE